jgi:hypothetical protein
MDLEWEVLRAARALGRDFTIDELVGPRISHALVVDQRPRLVAWLVDAGYLEGTGIYRLTPKAIEALDREPSMLVLVVALLAA